jgi:hypothetical protein
MHTALRLLRNMIDNSLSPDVRLYNTLSESEYRYSLMTR